MRALLKWCFFRETFYHDVSLVCLTDFHIASQQPPCGDGVTITLDVILTPPQGDVSEGCAIAHQVFGLSHDLAAIYFSAVLFALPAWSIPVLMAALAGDVFGPRLVPLQPWDL